MYKIVTEEDIIDENINTEVCDWTRLIKEEIRNTQVLLPSTFDIILASNIENDEKDWRYYIVDHVNKAILWLDDYDASEINVYANGLPNMRHLSR